MEDGAADEMTGEETSVSELHAQRREVGERVQDLEGATEEAFAERKDDIALAVARLAGSVQEAGSTSYQTAARPAPLSAPVES